ncbi:hypothetical protein [Pseudomarimonas arenosa]|uniref:Uncharacterized protein n=1 Tax=Pseudomarimonas arenosa TaxID=2774145 RepID=A0AAW3ZTH9_9GAMM|nr:hypothetical protein [Pseudomarimonas arenosa]MBD8528317.1 hypothetical protein [Pseudomarimonas arenosa]
MFLTIVVIMVVQVPCVHARKETRTPAVEAFAAAYNDFEKRVREQNPGDSDLERHLGNMTNYRMTIVADGSSLVVEIVPLPMNGESLRGGGARYVVDTETAVIVKFEPFR